MTASETPIRVLYVDEESRFRSTVAEVLPERFARMEIRTEMNPESGLEYLDRPEANTDCVVSEHDFEFGDGIEFLRSAREGRPDLPFILFTDNRDADVTRRAVSADVTEYLPKSESPEHVASLGERIVDAVERFRSTAEEREARSRLEELTRASTDCLWIFDSDWEELLFLSGYEEVWERPREAIEDDARDFLNGIHPDDRESARQKMVEMSAGQSIDVEFRILKGERKSDGETETETGWIWVKGEPVFDDEGNVVRVVGFTRDVTDRKERARGIRRNERRFEAMLNDPNILVGLLETDGTVLNINDTSMEYVDADLESIIGDPFWQTPWFSGDSDLQRRVRDCSQRANAGEYVEFEFDLTEAVGEPLIINGMFRPVVDDGGTVTSILISGRDITTQREHERELELRTRAIDEAPVGIVITDPHHEDGDNPITYANEGFQEVTQYEETEVVGRNCRFLQGPLTDERSRAALRKAVEERQPIEQNILNYRKDSTPFWNHVQVTPVFDEAGELTHFIGFQSDVTTRVEQERRTAILQRMLQHNIRNDLNVILGNLSLLEEDADAEVEAIDRAREAAIRLLELSRTAREIESELERASFEPRVTDLEALLKAEIDRVSESYEGVTIRAEFEPDLSVLAPDPVSIAIRELLENAVEHAPDSDLSVRITTESDRITTSPDDAERDVAIVHIEDSNPAISDLELRRLRGEDESPIQHGTGLGLWLVNWMLTMSGGLISHESIEPTGNRISITLLRAIDDGE